jgi:hypothetical protein
MSGSTAPQTYDEVVEWFTTSHKRLRRLRESHEDVVYDETIKQFTTAVPDADRGTHDEAMLRQLLTGMQEHPGLSAPMRPSTAWSLILEHGLMYRDARSGWVTREGVMLGACFAAIFA